jgi:hypothetical protein
MGAATPCRLSPERCTGSTVNCTQRCVPTGTSWDEIFLHWAIQPGQRCRDAFPSLHCSCSAMSCCRRSECRRAAPWRPASRRRSCLGTRFSSQGPIVMSTTPPSKPRSGSSRVPGIPASGRVEGAGTGDLPRRGDRRARQVAARAVPDAMTGSRVGRQRAAPRPKSPYLRASNRMHPCPPNPITTPGLRPTTNN